MKLFSTFLAHRRLLRTLERIATAQEQQLPLLQRLADQFAPIPVPFNQADLKQTGPSFSKDEEQARIVDFVDRCWKDLQRAPTEDEVCDWLDGKMARLQ